jgi:hypothetical protein
VETAGIVEAFVAEARRQVEGMKAKGCGLGDDGKIYDAREGVFPRVTPSRVLENVTDELEGRGLRLRNADHRDVEDALYAAGWSARYLGVKRFFCPPEAPDPRPSHAVCWDAISVAERARLAKRDRSLRLFLVAEKSWRELTGSEQMRVERLPGLLRVLPAGAEVLS